MTGPVWALIGPDIGGRLQRVERSDDETLRLLDMRSGVDYWRWCRDGGIAIASRVQWPDEDYRSHTIRYRGRDGSAREFFRLQEALRPGAVATVPHVMIHAYLRPDRPADVVRVGLARTRDLMAVAASLLASDGDYALRPNQDDGTLFVPVWWKAVHDAGMPLVLFEPDPQAMFNEAGLQEFNGGRERLWTSL